MSRYDGVKYAIRFIFFEESIIYAKTRKLSQINAKFVAKGRRPLHAGYIPEYFQQPSCHLPISRS
jgi:hypothetical protein